MLTIIGLGNPGREYQNTRHNTGFMFVDYWAEKEKLSWRNEKFLKSAIAGREGLVLAKPSTFMNKSGIAVKKIMDKINQEKLNFTYAEQIDGSLHFDYVSDTIFGEGIKGIFSDASNQLLVVHDELDLRLGEWKLNKSKSSPLHKGVSSIEDYLKAKDFWRLRIGVDNRLVQERIPGEKYVLQPFAKDEIDILQNTFAKMLEKTI
jgi:PTH1 family peptidyl-tRNA hydrolase